VVRCEMFSAMARASAAENLSILFKATIIGF
jgi:hypothetical protein